MVTKLVQSTYPPSGGRPVRTATETFSATGSMEWTRFENTNITAQLSGTATTGTAVVERSAVDPGPDGALAAPSPADDTAFTGNLVTGLSPRVYVETGVGWWRVRVTAATAGTVICGLSGYGS